MPARDPLPLSPQQTVLLAFTGAILVGTALLALPLSTVGPPLRPLDALFTATSAVCVTGLTVVDTATHFTLFGRIVILVLVQLGGLGFATFSTFAAVLIGRRIGLRERIVLRETLQQTSFQGLVRLATYVLRIAFAVQAAGALALTIAWLPDYGLPDALGLGVFHAISAFNNAGFDLFGGFRSLEGQTPWIHGLIAALVVLGGLGFTVLSDLSKHRRWRDWSFHTKIVLVTTLLLIVGGTVLIWASEYTSRIGLAQEPWYVGGAQALFLSIMARTAGFASFGFNQLGSATLMVLMFLMFVGASPNSTGSGIKTTTFASLILSVWATVRGKREVTLFNRRLPDEVIRRAIAISILSGLWVALATVAMALIEPQIDFIRLLFEVISAFSTTGASTGITPALSTGARLVLIVTMLAGRIGLLTFVIALTTRETSPIRYPEGRLSVG